MSESEFVVSVMKNERVWRWLKVDGISKESLRYEPNSTYFVNLYGFMMFRQIYPLLWEVHICMTKGAKDVDKFASECLEKMRTKGVKKFMAPIGEWNLPALKLAKRCGFKEEGRIPKAYQRDGEYKSMVLMGSE